MTKLNRKTWFNNATGLEKNTKDGFRGERDILKTPLAIGAISNIFQSSLSFLVEWYLI